MVSQPPVDLDPRRVVPLPGSRNFRDLGGYSTRDGREVRWGLVYRSGSLAGLTADGAEALQRLGVRCICDLRTSHERTSASCAWSEAPGFSYWSRDYETSFGELRRLMAAALPDATAAREAMLAGYQRLPFEQAPAYAELFHRIAAGELPMVFNCSAGKDRAGTGAALILTALGVPRETVIADYVLTDSVVDLAGTMTRPAEGGLLARQSPQVVRAILGCDPAYIAAALDAVAPDDAAFAVYMKDTLGVTPTTLEMVRRRLLA